MLSGLRNFVTRHRRKFLITGLVIGGTLMATRYAKRKFVELQERQARALIERNRRTAHFESTERTCNQMITSMGEELCAEVLKQCSTEQLLNELRNKPANKVALWQQMKLIAFTRLTAFIYGASILVIVLRVQLNLLGGYIYRDIVSNEQQLTDELKQQYLSMVQHFIRDGGGLTRLINVIRAKVALVLNDMPLDKQLTLPQIEELFWSIQMSINSDVATDPNIKLAQYAWPATPPPACARHALLHQMYNETLDLLECADASVVCTHNVSRGFSVAADELAERLGELVQSLPAKPNSDDEPNVLKKLNTYGVALAKLIPIISSITSRGYDTQTWPRNLPTLLITFYVVAEKSKTLGANVYESFCSPSSVSGSLSSAAA